MTTYTTYVNPLNGTTYGLPDSSPESFRESHYVPAASGTSDPTRSNARIRAVIYAWMDRADLNPTDAGPFLTSLTEAEQVAMTAGTGSTLGSVAFFSDSGYAPLAPEGGEGCTVETGLANPWDYLTSAFGSNITTYYTPSPFNLGTMAEGTNFLDLWQASSSDLSANSANVLIVSDVVQLCTPTQYANNNSKPYPSFGGDYRSVQTVFNNLYALTNAGGFIIFSVPYDGDPNGTTGEASEAIHSSKTNLSSLYNWEYAADEGLTKIENTEEEAVTATVHTVNFTEGTNCPAIMRSFTRGAVYEYLETAGFIDIHVFTTNTEMNKLGIFWNATIDAEGKWTAQNSDAEGELGSKSLVMCARRAAEEEGEGGGK